MKNVTKELTEIRDTHAVHSFAIVGGMRKGSLIKMKKTKWMEERYEFFQGVWHPSGAPA